MVWNGQARGQTGEHKSMVIKFYVLSTGTSRAHEAKKSNSALQRDPTYMDFKCLLEHITQILP